MVRDSNTTNEVTSLPLRTVLASLRKKVLGLAADKFLAYIRNGNNIGPCRSSFHPLGSRH